MRYTQAQIKRLASAITGMSLSGKQMPKQFRRLLNMPPSMKPTKLRDEGDLERLDDAKSKREMKAEKRLKWAHSAGVQLKAVA